MTTALATTTKLSKHEDELLQALLKDKSKILAVSIPDDSAPADVLTAIRSCCSMIGKMEGSSGKIKALLGRLMVLARKNEEVWKQAGYKSYDKFVSGELEQKYGMSRASLWEAKRIMTAFPDLTINTYGQIGTQKLTLLAKYTNYKDGACEKLLQRAQENTHETLRLYLEDKYSDPGGTIGASFKLTGSKAKVRELEKFLKREDIQAAAESDDPLEIILAMTQEVEAEWIEKGEAKLAEAEKEAEGATEE